MAFLALNWLMPAASSKMIAPVARRGLQQCVDFALLDDAVGFRGDAGAGQHFANVAQAAGLPVEQIFALAAAIHAARDVHFLGVDRQPAVFVVERERRFAGAQRRARWRSR